MPAHGSRSAHRRRFTRHSSAGEVVLAYLDAQAAKLSVIARKAAREIGVQAHLAGENAFSFGLLHERAHRQAIACADEARHAWRRSRRRKSRGWLPKS
jgi:hypothetical protein